MKEDIKDIKNIKKLVYGASRKQGDIFSQIHKQVHWYILYINFPVEYSFMSSVDKL